MFWESQPMEAFCVSLILPLCVFAKNLILAVEETILVCTNAYRSFGRKARPLLRRSLRGRRGQ